MDKESENEGKMELDENQMAGQYVEDCKDIDVEVVVLNERYKDLDGGKEACTSMMYAELVA